MASLRRLAAVLTLVCGGVLAVGAGPALAQGAAERPPSELWQEYPLEPLAEEAPAQSLPGLRPLAGAESSSPDRMLLIGGLALFVLVLSDTVFLALSTRALRG